MTQSALAVVYVDFQQVGSDVRVSFDGMLELSGVSSGGSFNSTGDNLFDQAASILYVADHGTSYIDANVGTSTASSLAVYSVSSFNAEFTFGFNQFNLLWDADIVTSGTAGTPTTLTLEEATHFYTLANTTLAALGADQLTEGQVLWTATGTGDTIAVAVPEPSSSALLGLGAIALFSRRRRS